MNETPLDTTPVGSAVGPIRRADALGITSALLGAPMVAMPHRFLDAIGIEPDEQSVTWTRIVGVREFAATQTINLMRHRRVGAWSRVGGDLMDLTLLARAYVGGNSTNRSRLTGAIAAVVGILTADVVTAVQLSRADHTLVSDGAGSEGSGTADPVDGEGFTNPAHIRTAITVRAPEEEVRARFKEFGWSAFDPSELEARGAVRFLTAPGDRGTEVHIDHDTSPVGGRVTATALSLAGRSPAATANDELRQFKALIETGVIPRSDHTPAGPSSPEQIAQRPGQPVGTSGR